MSEVVNKIVKVVFITILSICLLISTGILGVLAASGADTILAQGGSTITLTPISIIPPTNPLWLMGQSFVMLLFSLSSLFLFFFVVIFWVCFMVWILRNEIIIVLKWIFGIRFDLSARTIKFPRFGGREGEL